MCDSYSQPSQRFAIILSILFFSLAVILWPGIFRNFISLDWKVGDMRPVAYVLEAFLVSFGIFFLLKRHRVNASLNQFIQDRKKIGFTVFGLLFFSTLIFIIMEVTLRVLDLPYGASWTPQEYYRVQFDQEIGWVYVPNKTTEQQFVPGQPEIELYSDSIGSRVGAPGLQHDPDAPTILFLGGSYTYGFGLPYDETFVARLGEMPDFPYQTVNMGVEAYGTDQSMLLLKRHLSKFNTKVVIYTFIDNHIERNINYDRRILFRGGRFIGTKPLFELDNNGELYIKKEPKTYEELKEVYLWSFAQFAWVKWGPKPFSEDILLVGYAFTSDKEYQKAVNLTQALILEMKDFVETQGAKFILFYWSYGNKSDNNPESARDIVRPMLDELDIDLIDISVNAPPDWSWENYRLPNDSHPSAKATDIAAQLLFDEFLQRGLLSQGTILTLDK